MLLLCGLAWGAEDFNVASCLQLNTVEHAAKEEYEKATMNMADDIREVKKNDKEEPGVCDKDWVHNFDDFCEESTCCRGSSRRSSKNERSES